MKGAKYRTDIDHNALQNKIAKNTGEMKKGDLKSSTGHTVTDRDQMLAISYSQARKKKG